MAEQNHRMCISCRKTAHRDTLLRIVRTYPDHCIQLNHGMGRSAYLCATSACWQAAKKKNRLSRALKSRVSPDTYQQLEADIQLAISNSSQVK